MYVINSFSRAILILVTMETVAAAISQCRPLRNTDTRHKPHGKNKLKFLILWMYFLGIRNVKFWPRRKHR